MWLLVLSVMTFTNVLIKYCSMNMVLLYLFSAGARRDGDGYIWVTGRIDDMLNVSGHLLSTAQVCGDCLIKEVMKLSEKLY